MNDKENNEEDFEDQEDFSEDDDQETPDPEPLSEETVTVRLDETNLPDVSKARLSEAEYADEDALEEAVTTEIDYVKTITKSGKPFGVKGKSQRHEPRTEEKCQEDYDRIMVEAGGREVYG